MGFVSTRLQQVHPDVSAWFRSHSSDRQAALARRAAEQSVESTGQSVPSGDVDLVEWAEEVDARGWSSDAAGEPRQDETDFARARAAFALRDALTAGSRTEALEDSLYESIAALGLDAVQDLLGRIP